MQSQLFYSCLDQQVGRYGVVFVEKDGRRGTLHASCDDLDFVMQYAYGSLHGAACQGDVGSYAEIFEVPTGNAIAVCRLSTDRAVLGADVSGMVHQLQVARQQFLGRVVVVPLLPPCPPARGRVSWVEMDIEWNSGLPLVCVVLENGLTHVLTVAHALRECRVIY